MLVPDKNIEFPDWEPHFNKSGNNTVTTIKSQPGILGMARIVNPNNSDMWWQLFDEEGAIMVGTTVPVLSIMVSAGDGILNGLAEVNQPIRFTKNIKYACTTTKDGNVAPANDLIINAVFL